MPWQSLLPPLLAVAAAGAGLAGMAAQLRKARLIEDTPTSKIRSAAQGYVELSGFARACADETPLLAPLTQAPCAWFKYRIERYDRSGEGSRWRTVESGTSDRWFELDDGSGRCHVDPRGAEITAARRERWTGSSRVAERAGMRRHIGPLDLLTGGRFALGGDYRYTEWHIASGSFLYALGHFETVHGPSLAERTQEQTRALLNHWKQNRDELLGRFDRNGDGEIDLQEWEEARRAAARAAAAQAAREPAAPALNVLCRPDQRDRPYLIAASDPERLARRHRWQAAGALGLGVIGALAALHHGGI